jgi:hypothetical protein
LSKAEEDGLISGVKICRDAPSISHLLFADDSLILIQAKGEHASQLRSILELYEICSGLMINKSKSAILFSKNTCSSNTRAVKDAIEVEKETISERYLGLPVHIGNSRSKVFSYLKECGKEFRAGRKIFYHGQVKRF